MSSKGPRMWYYKGSYHESEFARGSEDGYRSSEELIEHYNLDTHAVPRRGLTIWDTGSEHFTLAHLFTGTSRSRSGDLLQIV